MKISIPRLIILILTLILFGLAAIALVFFTFNYLMSYRTNHRLSVSYGPIWALLLYDPIIVLANIVGFVFVLLQKSPPGRLKALAGHILCNLMLIMTAIVLVILFPPVGRYGSTMSLSRWKSVGLIFIGPELLGIAIAGAAAFVVRLANS